MDSNLATRDGLPHQRNLRADGPRGRSIPWDVVVVGDPGLGRACAVHRRSR